ncbi:MAG: hypothetical protein K1X54_11055 [Flavobacteriales bacterium]|nr:hypothetical protein [Flavobacteriales bacterium]
MKNPLIPVVIVPTIFIFCHSVIGQNEATRQDALSPSIHLQWYDDGAYCLNITGKSDSCLTRPQYSFCFVDDEFERLNVNYDEIKYCLIRFDKKELKYYYEYDIHRMDTGYYESSTTPESGFFLFAGTGCKNRQFNIEFSDKMMPISISEYEQLHNRLSETIQGIGFNFIDGHAKFLRYYYNGNCWLMVHFKKKGRIQRIAVRTPNNDGYYRYKIKKNRLVLIKR